MLLWEKRGFFFEILIAKAVLEEFRVEYPPEISCARWVYEFLERMWPSLPKVSQHPWSFHTPRVLTDFGQSVAAATLCQREEALPSWGGWASVFMRLEQRSDELATLRLLTQYKLNPS